MSKAVSYTHLDVYKRQMEAILHPDIRILSIATRPDCLSTEILDLLERLNQIKPVWVELGLQTIHEMCIRDSPYLNLYIIIYFTI